MVVARDIGYKSPQEAVIAPSQMRRISWGAVIAGVVIAIIIQVTMNILGLAVGAGAVDPTAPQPNIGPALGTGIVIWLACFHVTWYIRWRLCNCTFSRRTEYH